MFNDVLLAFQRLSAPTISATVESDPLGDVNKIVRLRCGGRVVKTALCHVPDDAPVMVGRANAPTISLFDMDWNLATRTYSFVGYYVEVDGRRVIEATDAEMRLPAPPAPHIPWKFRVKRWVDRAAVKHLQPRADRLAERLGYHRECGY